MKIQTEYGEISITRSDTKYISIVKAKRTVRHHRKIVQAGNITHVEHRRPPRLINKIKLNLGGWAEYIATFDITGNKINLKCCENG